MDGIAHDVAFSGERLLAATATKAAPSVVAAPSL
jgi:hypothetical protein